MPRAARRPAVVAVAAAAAVLGTWLLTLVLPAARRADAALGRALEGAHHTAVGDALQGLVRLCDPRPGVWLAAAVVAVALLAGRPRAALAAAAILIGANLTTQGLKDVLDALDPATGAGRVALEGTDGYPSGHTTAAVSLVLALRVAVPAGLRGAVLLVGLPFAAAVGTGMVVHGAHVPTHVVGGAAVAVGWAAAAALVHAVARVREDRRVVSRRPSPAP